MALGVQVERAGGKIAVPKTTIGGGFGSFALFMDPEGRSGARTGLLPGGLAPREVVGKSQGQEGRQ